MPPPSSPPHLSPPYEFILPFYQACIFCEIVLSTTRIIPQLEIRSKSLVCTTMEYVMGADSVCCIDTKGVCDIVTCNKKYIFGLHPSFWHRAPKTWNFLCDESYKGVFCYVIGLTLEPHLRMGAGCQENQPCD